MARATRSSATLVQGEKDLPRPKSSSASARKRKRPSVPADSNDGDEPHAKHIRHTKQEDSTHRDPLAGLPLAAHVPVAPSDARHILRILERIDSQALLDRVFPIQSADPSQPSSSKPQSASVSLRALLTEPLKHPLRVLRAAVQNLFPISYHPRSRPSLPAAQQLRFCNLACSLLDQASFHSVPIPLDIHSLLHHSSDAKPSPSGKLPSASHAKKYALMQRLPFATYWSSLNSDLVPSDTRPIKDLSTANAELVAILPSPSAPASVEPGSTEQSRTTLASYVPKIPPGYKSKLPGPRRVSCGAFLDYGPYTSFAPAFEQDGVEIGRSAMGELFSGWEDRKKRWEDDSTPVTLPAHEEAPHTPQLNGIDKHDVLDEDQDLFQELFSKEQIALLKKALGSLELEAAVQELLERNARALARLVELQNKRLSEPGGFSPVEEGSEEWDTAQGIFDSLCLLASLRPRSSNVDNAPLIPSPSVLHRLQRTLPIAPTQGWQGTLPPEHATALRDDSTLYIKSTATAVPAAPSAPPAHAPTPTQPTPARASATTAAATAQAYANYSYNYAAPYRTGYQFKPGQPAPYYPNAYAQATAQAQATPQYYPGQPYAAAGQQQYAYSSWYQYNPPAQTSAPTAGSRKGTPQPSATAATPATPSPMPTSYAGFFSATTQTPGQRAVANTVAAATPGGKPYQPAGGGTWTAPPGTSAAAAGYVASTLPPHMRAPVAGQAGVAGAYGAGLYQPNYYGAYQATPSPAQS